MEFVAESFDPATKNFLCTTLQSSRMTMLSTLASCINQNARSPSRTTLSALVRLPDYEIYPELLTGEELTVAPVELDLSTDYYFKRPRLFRYDEYKAQECVDIIPALPLEKAYTLEELFKHPRPPFVQYHGCRVRRDFVTGLVLDRHVGDLKDYVSKKKGQHDKGPVMEALESAVSHLHSLGLVHNDVNPPNILVNTAGLPVLADFDSCPKVGRKSTYSRGTSGWVNESDSYDTSETSHDIYKSRGFAQGWANKRPARDLFILLTALLVVSESGIWDTSMDMRERKVHPHKIGEASPG